MFISGSMRGINGEIIVNGLERQRGRETERNREEEKKGGVRERDIRVEKSH